MDFLSSLVSGGVLLFCLLDYRAIFDQNSRENLGATMMHNKSESDVTSLAPSSPRSPKRATYFVQSPSRDSHDGDKSSTTHATPVYNSPMESPTHPSYGRHSRTSSGSRFSGTLRSWSERKTHRKRNDVKGWNEKGWPECNVIQEEGAYDDIDDKGLSRRCQILIGFVVFVLFFTTLCLIIWGATKQYEPSVAVKSMELVNFIPFEGTDHTGVPTNLVTANISLALKVYNSAPTFGIHVTSGPINILYSEITIATGELKKYYQPQKSHHIVTIILQGDKVPLYGAGAGLVFTSKSVQIPLRLEFGITTRGYVVGKLVRTTHHKQVSCKFTIDPSKTKSINIFKNTCTYT